jgi:hypothetical protein
MRTVFDVALLASSQTPLTQRTSAKAAAFPDRAIYREGTTTSPERSGSMGLFDGRRPF